MGLNISTIGERSVPSSDDVVCIAAAEVDDLAAQLERLLDRQHHFLVHRLRLAAETLGAMRMAASLRHPR